jgi:hypothetical protein
VKTNQNNLTTKIKQAFLSLLISIIYILIASIILANCHLADMTITIDDDVQGDHAQIKNETIQGVEFYCQYHSGLECDKFQSGLEVHIKTSVPPIYNADGTTTPAIGWYVFPYQYIEMLWLNGVIDNALFHELMHHHHWVHGKKEYTHDNDEEMRYFLGVEYDIRRLWKEDRGL